MMTDPLAISMLNTASDVTGGKDSNVKDAETSAEMAKQFEQMLWTEMLSHSGLEEAFTLGGGQGASAFSRYLVESIAEDLVDKHPLGLGDTAVQPPSAKNLMPGKDI